MVSPNGLNGEKEVELTMDMMHGQERQDDEEMAYLKDMVYFNDIIMERVISYVPSNKDRNNVELCSKRMRALSLRSPFNGLCVDNSILDLNYTMVNTSMSMNVAGNRVNVPSLTATERVSMDKQTNGQPPLTLLVMKALLTRFGKQIKEIRLGGITDCERRLGYIPDHQLVVTRDLCELLDKLPRVKSLSLRNCCVTSNVLQYWAGEDSALMHKVASLCIHSIWFDKTEDCNSFVKMISSSVRRLHLSDCGGKTMTNVVNRFLELGTVLNFLYAALDFRTFKNQAEAWCVLGKLNKATQELHLCVCMTNMAVEPGYRALLEILPRVVELSSITSIQLDVGAFRNINSRAFQRFFNGLVYMNNLRSLYMSGKAISHYTLSMWSNMVKGIAQLSNLESLGIHELGKNVTATSMDELCCSLPATLKTFALGNSLQFSTDNMMHLVERCPNLKSLYLRSLHKVRLPAMMTAIESLKHLQGLALIRMGPMTEAIYRLVADRERMPSLEAVILGGNKYALPSEVLSALYERYPTVMFACHSSRWKEAEYCMYRIHQAYTDLLSTSWFTECPNCERDVSLIEDDDF